MFRFVLKLLPGAILLAAAIYLAVSGSEENSFLHYLAAIAVAIPPALQVRDVFSDRFGITSSKKASLNAALRTALLTVYRAPTPLTSQQLTQLGFHVWLVPKWRRLVPYAVRRKVHYVLSEQFREDHASHHRLRRAAVCRLDPPQGSDVPIRRGHGIVGGCLALNKHDKTDAIDWERPDRVALLSASDREDWQRSAAELNRGLKFEHAQALAASYGQAAAMVIWGDHKEPIGVVTLDLPKGVGLSLEDASGDVLLTHLTSLRDQLETIRRL